MEVTRALSQSVVALAEHQQGNTEKATTALQQATQLLEKLERLPPDWYVNDVLMARILHHEAQAKIKNGLKDLPLVTIHSYAGQEHAFARHKGTHYDADAAKLANNRTVEMFERHLR